MTIFLLSHRALLSHNKKIRKQIKQTDTAFRQNELLAATRPTRTKRNITSQSDPSTTAPEPPTGEAFSWFGSLRRTIRRAGKPTMLRPRQPPPGTDASASPTLVIFRLFVLALFCTPGSGFVTPDGREGFSNTETGASLQSQRVLPLSLPSHTGSGRTLGNTSLACQLLGMNCATPTDFTFSLKGFCKRGGETDIHSDGWGVAFYEGKGIRQFHDSSPACSSPMANFLESNPIRTYNMMSHLRYATVGEVELSNVHPFCREMWGINFAFAMNGDIPMFKKDPKSKLRALMDPGDLPSEDQSYYNAVGNTDSEAAFCAILNALRVKFQQLPSLPVLKDAINELCEEIITEDPKATIMNFLLTCGPDTLWVYSWPGSRPGSKVWNGLHYTTRAHPFTTSRLRDVDYEIDFASTNKAGDCVSVIATKPLTHDEHWIEIGRGELIVFDQGRPHVTPESLFEIELLGHGLKSSVIERPVLEEDMREFDLDPESFQGSFI